MFTGLVEKKAQVVANIKKTEGHRLILSNPFEQVEVGESIAVNGVCLTLLPDNENTSDFIRNARFERSLLSFDLSFETLHVTNLANLIAGDEVNLERALCLGERLGGHYVTGHVDATVAVKEIKRHDDFIELHIGPFPSVQWSYLVPKGSITLEGVSLTINSMNNGSIFVCLVPHTLSMTTLNRLTPNQLLNVEFDYIARILIHQANMASYLNNEVLL